MIYLKDPTDSSNVIKANREELGAAFDFWEELTDSEAIAYDLSVAQSAKIVEVKAARETFQYTNVIVNDLEYKATQNAKLLFFNKVNGTSSYPMSWRLSDDVTFVSLTEEEASAIYSSFEQQESLAYQQESAYLVQIATCSSAEEVENIEINFSS